MLNWDKTVKVLKQLERAYGNIGTALEFETPFQLLVATVLAAQSTDKQVNKITASLFKKYPDAAAMADMPVEKLEQEIKSIGLYKNKAKNIVALSRKIISEHRGEVPQERDKLEKLPGVGRKTASVVLSVGFGKPAIAVDTHVFRVSNRIGLAEAANVKLTEQQLMENIPESQWSDAHHWLIWHGRKICKARNPLCEQCPIEKWCEKNL